MNDPYNLQRFVDAQEGVHEIALAELRGGQKQSHWMWFIFPQLSGLGRSSTAQYYGLGTADEARAYLRHSVLGPRLYEAVDAILQWAGKRAPEKILGGIDAIKLRSCLTLFDAVEPNGIFGRALSAFFDGPDERTLALLAQAG